MQLANELGVIMGIAPAVSLEPGRGKWKVPDRGNLRVSEFMYMAVVANPELSVARSGCALADVTDENSELGTMP